MTIDEVMEQFPVTRDQIKAVLEFAARSLDAFVEFVAQPARLIDPSAVSPPRNPRRLNVLSLLMTRLLSLTWIHKITFFVWSLMQPEYSNVWEISIPLWSIN